MPKAAVLSRRSASISRLKGTTGSRSASPRPTSTSSQEIDPNGAGSDDDGGHQTRHRQRDRQPLEPGDLVADGLGEQDVRRPAGGRAEREQDADGVDRPRARAGSAAAPRLRRARATASCRPGCARRRRREGRGTPAALAVPSGSRATAAMNSMVSPGGHDAEGDGGASRTRPGEVRARRGRTSTSRITPGPGQPEPGRALRADLVEEAHRDREAQLDATSSTPRAIEGAGAGVGERWS